MVTVDLQRGIPKVIVLSALRDSVETLYSDDVGIFASAIKSRPTLMREPLVLGMSLFYLQWKITKRNRLVRNCLFPHTLKVFSPHPALLSPPHRGVGHQGIKVEGCGEAN